MNTAQDNESNEDVKSAGPKVVEDRDVYVCVCERARERERERERERDKQ